MANATAASGCESGGAERFSTVPTTSPSCLAHRLLWDGRGDGGRFVVSLVAMLSGEVEGQVAGAG